ncbi:uncharacterized protein LOC134697806 [Mytilus trossulus]|uniref:uncharacterized protein LOC134697806 n=1 Tax=Mytilus trossulus TaxID=6551 RepID=UPI003003DA7F
MKTEQHEPNQKPRGSQVLRKANDCGGKNTGHGPFKGKQFLDGKLKGFGIIATSRPFRFGCCGTIKKWRAVTKGPGEVIFQVWRHSDKKNHYILIGQNLVKFDKAGDTTVDIPQSERISVDKGDYIGWYTVTEAFIVHEENVGSKDHHIIENMPVPVEGQDIDWSKNKVKEKRIYAVEAMGEDSVAPSFKNLPFTKVITKAEVDSMTDPMNVYDVQGTDPDKQDIPTLLVHLEAVNAYFQIRKNTSMVLMVKHAPLGSHVLKIEVKDTCGKNKIDELTVEIKDDSPTDAPSVVTKAPTVPTTTPDDYYNYDDHDGDDNSAVSGTAAPASGTLQDFEWDWLVAVLIVAGLIILLAALIFIFHKNGWLHKHHRTMPMRKNPKDVESSDGLKTETKIDDLNKPENKPDVTSNNGTKPNDAAKPKPDTTKSKYSKSKY